MRYLDFPQLTRGRSWLTTPCVLLLAFCLSACASSGSGSPSPEPSSLRRLPAGEVVGFVGEYGSHVWQGIPYGRPPTGSLRWRAPLPVPPFAETLQALKTGNACPQYASIFSGEDRAAGGTLIGDEDCLYLDVYAPLSDAAALPKGEKRLPVMLWIHGGSNVIGRGGFYNGGNLAQRHDVIVVSINYRLGPFGWFRHDALRRETANPAEQSGNFATLDMILALDWVQENIAGFGGDPGNVTIFGESAGGTDVFTLLLSPLAEGKFHRAIIQSGGMGIQQPENAEALYSLGADTHPHSSNEILVKLLADGVSRASALEKLAAMTPTEVAVFLRSRSPHEILSSYETEESEGMIDVPTVFGDGHVIPSDDPMELLARGDYHQVPIMLGTNRDENKLFMIYDPDLVDWWFGAIPRPKDKDLYMAVAEHQANAWKARSVDVPAARMRKVQGESVYAYRWDWDEEPGIPLLYDGGELVGAGHGLEIPFVFGHFDLGPETGMLFNSSNRAARLALSDQMMSYWAEFAYSGSPARGRTGDLPLWRNWDDSDSRSPKYMVLDTSSSGGSRMETSVYTIDGIVAALIEDSRIESVQSKCAVLRNMENWEYIDAFEYTHAGNGLCAGYALAEYPWAEVAAE